jgi:hypothetical protein
VITPIIAEVTTKMVSPKAAGETTTIPTRSRTRAPAAEPEIEETLSTSSPEPLRFHHNYIPPRKDDAPLVMSQRYQDYRMVTPYILEAVIINEYMLGKVLHLKYVDHDIIDVENFPELMPHEYLELQIDPQTQQNIQKVKVWARGLERASLLNLFDIPHFGGNNEINAWHNLLISCIHGGRCS